MSDRSTHRPSTDTPMPTNGPSAAAVEAEAEEIEADSGRSVGQYWREASPARRRVVAGAGVAVLVGSLIAVWFGLASGMNWPVQRDLGYTVHDAASTSVRFMVTKPPEMTAQCEVIAQEVGKAVVGRQTVTIPPADTPSTEHEVTLRTTTLAVHGSVKSCRPTE